MALKGGKKFHIPVRAVAKPKIIIAMLTTRFALFI